MKTLFMVFISLCYVTSGLDQNIKLTCSFKTLNSQFVSQMPEKLRSLMDCCVTEGCGGLSTHISSGNYITEVEPQWFINKTLADQTAYMVKKWQSWEFRTPEPGSDVIYQLPASFTEGAEVAVSVTPFTGFEGFRIRLQGTDKNAVIFMFVNGLYNRVSLKYKLDGEKVNTDVWEASISSSLDPFPFAGDVDVNVVFTNIGNAIQIKIDDVIYTNFTSPLPLEWANGVKITDDVYINRIDFWNIITN